MATMDQCLIVKPNSNTTPTFHHSNSSNSNYMVCRRHCSPNKYKVRSLQPNRLAQTDQQSGQFAPFARNFSAEPLSNDFNHPNKLPGRPRKDGSIPKMDGSAGSAGSASNSDLEIEEEEPEAPPALIIGSPPTNEQARARYNAVKAVWSPRNKSAPIEKIKSGVIDFGETIRALRDAWKTRNDNLKQAELEGSSTASAAPKLKAEVAQYRQTAETLVKETLLFAHPAIMKRYVEPLLSWPLMRPLSGREWLRDENSPDAVQSMRNFARASLVAL